MADLPKSLHIPAILVVGVRLGCLNHALLTKQAIEAKGVAVAGWVANCIDPALERAARKLRTLSSDSWEAQPLAVFPCRADGHTRTFAAANSWRAIFLS